MPRLEVLNIEEPIILGTASLSTRFFPSLTALSWGAYLVSAVVRLLYGLQKRDRNIYLPCLGWIALDVAANVGAPRARAGSALPWRSGLV